MNDCEKIHQPVMVAETLRFLSVRPGGAYCDATLGLGGHSEALLRAMCGTGVLYGIDRDKEALDLASKRLSHFGPRFQPVYGEFGQIIRLLGERQAPLLDGIVADLGVSSLQLDRPGRGFSFRAKGPLDMRMDPSHGETAYEAICRLDETKLAAVLREYGEERHSLRIARALKAAVSTGRLDTTQVADVVAAAIPQPHIHKHPATRVFQALRIFVNDELRELHQLLLAAPRLLVPGGRLVVISFHSLEDRLVKQHFAFSENVAKLRREQSVSGTDNRAPFVALMKNALFATEDEVRANPRARSARLRAAQSAHDAEVQACRPLTFRETAT